LGFNSYTDGTTIGATSRWTSVCGGCLSGDFFEVNSRRFVANDVNNFSTWESEIINISAFTTVDFSLDAIEQGDHEGPTCGCGVNIDYFDVYYSIDGAPFTVIQDWNGDGDIGYSLTGDSQNGTFTDNDWNSTRVIQTGLSGSTLVIRVVMRNTSSTEFLELDNVEVSSTIILPVELSRFEGIIKENQVYLEWTTSSEINHNYFELEKSVDATHFTKVTKLAAQGGEGIPTNYQFQDVYGLGLSYSKMIRVRGKEQITKLPFPNPFTNELYIELPIESTIKAFSTLTKGRQNIVTYLQDFPSGLLLLSINNSYGSQLYKMYKGSN